MKGANLGESSDSAMVSIASAGVERGDKATLAIGLRLEAGDDVASVDR